MKTRLGAILAILLGAALIATGTMSGGATVGATTVSCGSVPIGVVSPGCPRGAISIDKVVVGPGTRPSAGWTFTIASTNCTLFPGTSANVHIPAAGGIVKSGTLYSTQNSLVANGSGPACDYTVTETAVAGWTTTYSPTGVLHLGQSLTANNDVSLTVTNTSPTPTPTPSASSSVIIDTTSSPAPTTASASPTGTLANTGSKNVQPATYIGIALVLGGVVMLFASRRRKTGQH